MISFSTQTKRLFHQLGFEASISFLLGAVPLFLAALSNNTSVLASAAQALVPKGFGMWFVVGLSGFSLGYLLIVAWAPPQDKPGFLTKVFLEVYKEARALFRISAGVLLGFCVIWLWSDYQSVDLKLLWFLLFGLAALAESTIFSLFVDWLEKRRGLAP